MSGSSGKLSWPRRLGFAVGEGGQAMAGVPINALMLYYLTDTLALRPALAGLVIGLPKFWDMLIDPWLGGFVERAGRRAGRRAPVALAAAACYVGAVVLLFALPALGKVWLTAGAAMALLMLWSTTQTALDVSRLSIADDMTVDPAERTTLLATAAIGAALLGLAATAAVPLLQATGGGRAGYARMAQIIGAASMTGLLLFVAAVWRYRARAAQAAVDLPLWCALRAVAANRGFLFLVGALVCLGLTGGVLGAFMPFANQYVLHGSQANLSVLLSIALVATLVALPLGAVLARRYGIGPVLRAGSSTVAAAFLLMYPASFGPPWLTWIPVGIFGLGIGALAVLLQSATLDLARQELPGGAVVPLGIYLGILVAGQKLGLAAGSFVAGVFLDTIGFVAGAAQQAAATVALLRTGYALVPFALVLVATLFLRHIDLRRPELPAPAAA